MSSLIENQPLLPLSPPVPGWRYREVERGVLRCLDWPEDIPLAPTG